MTNSIIRLFTVAAVFGGMATVANAQNASKFAQEPPNLALNGSFDDADDPLNHWLYAFDHNKHYMNNHKYVKVVPDDDGFSSRKNVLRLDATDHDICINQGVMVYTAPIRFNPKRLYKISISARSIGTKGGPGPKCRIYPIGYRWHPKAVKSAHPEFADLREAVRFQPLYFDNSKTGPLSNVQKQWKRVERVIPSNDRSELQQGHLENCEWLMLKILAMDATGVDTCNEGYLYIDDVKIQEIGDASEVKIGPASQTKGFDGKTWGTGAKSESQQKLTPGVGGPRPSGNQKKRTESAKKKAANAK